MSNLSFHFVLMFFASLNIFKCVFAKSHFSATLFVGVKFILISFFSFHNGCCFSEKVWLIITMNDLDFEVKDIAFEANVFNRYGTFYWIATKSMEDQGYAYL